MFCQICPGASGCPLFLSWCPLFLFFFHCSCPPLLPRLLSRRGTATARLLGSASCTRAAGAHEREARCRACPSGAQCSTKTGRKPAASWRGDCCIA